MHAALLYCRETQEVWFGGTSCNDLFPYLKVEESFAFMLIIFIYNEQYYYCAPLRKCNSGSFLSQVTWLIYFSFQPTNQVDMIYLGALLAIHIKANKLFF